MIAQNSSGWRGAGFLAARQRATAPLCFLLSSKALRLRRLEEWVLWREACAYEQYAMLRITVHEDGTVCRLELAGRLAGPWVAETEHTWRSSSCPDKQIEVDMRQVTAVDGAGRELLSAMHQAGARLVAQGVEMAALIEEITGKQPFDSTKQQRRRKKRSQGQRFPDQESK